MKKTGQGKNRNVVGGRVREARQQSNPPISQDDLAGKLAALGIALDRSAISRIESRNRYVMDYELVAISKCLKKPIAWFF
jgi:hypothetical protein